MRAYQGCAKCCSGVCTRCFIVVCKKAFQGRANCCSRVCKMAFMGVHCFTAVYKMFFSGVQIAVLGRAKWLSLFCGVKNSNRVLQKKKKDRVKKERYLLAKVYANEYVYFCISLCVCVCSCVCGCVRIFSYTYMCVCLCEFVPFVLANWRMAIHFNHHPKKE